MVWRPLICEKWLFVHFFNFKIFQIFLYCKFRQFKLFFWTRRWCQSSKKFFSPILDLSPNYFCLQIQYLDLYSYAFFHFAHYDRQQWFLAGTGGFSHQKIFSPILDLSPNFFVSKFIFSTLAGPLPACLLLLNLIIIHYCDSFKITSFGFKRHWILVPSLPAVCESNPELSTYLKKNTHKSSVQYHTHSYSLFHNKINVIW